MSDNPTAGANAIAAVRGGGYWKEIALIAALIAAGVTGYSWLKAHDAWIRFQIESRLKDQQIALRDKQAAADRETIEQLKKQTQTTQQVVREISKVISLPTPVSIAEPQPQQQKGGGSDVLPDAPQPQTGIVIPPEDVKPLFDRLADCKAMESQLSACQQNYLDMKKERDLAVQVHRGSFWQRAKQIAIGIAIGGAIGYAAHR